MNIKKTILLVIIFFITKTAFSHEIYHTESKQCLSIKGGQITNGKDVILEDCNGSKRQNFLIQGETIKMATNKNYCLDISQATNTKKLIIWRCHRRFNQKFAITNNKIMPKFLKNSCITDKGATLNAKKCNNSASQKFTIPKYCLYQHSRYRGYSLCGNDNVTILKTQFDDDFSSATVAHGEQITLYENRNFKDKAYLVNKNIEFFGYAFNDKASSILADKNMFDSIHKYKQKNVVFVSSTERLKNNFDDLTYATHVILFSFKPCDDDYYKLCGTDFGEAETMEWGEANLDDESLDLIYRLQNRGIKVLLGLVHNSNEFYDKIAEDINLFDVFAQNAALMNEYYELDGIDLDFEPRDLSKVPYTTLNFFIEKAREYLGKEKILSITPQQYAFKSYYYKPFYTYANNKETLDLIDKINVQYYDVGEKALEDSSLLSWVNNIISGFGIPAEKLVIGLAFGVNDTLDRWTYNPQTAANKVIKPLLKTYGENFAGIMGWRALNNKFYDLNWLKTIHTHFLAYDQGLLTQNAVISSNNRYLFTPQKGLYKIEDNKFTLIKDMPSLSGEFKLFDFLPDTPVLWDHGRYLHLLFGEKEYERFDLTSLPDQFSTEVNKIFYVLSDSEGLYLVTNVGVYSLRINSQDNELVYKYLGLWNMPSGGYTGAVLTKSNLLVTLGGNKGVYKYLPEISKFVDSRQGLPTNQGQTNIKEITANKNCVRVKVFNNYYYSRDGAKTWLKWSNMPKYFGCG